MLAARGYQVSSPVVVQPVASFRTERAIPYISDLGVKPTWQTLTDDDDDNISNSIQFNSLLLMCRVNSKRQLQKQHSVYTT
jgi:hypothetical protein